MSTPDDDAVKTIVSTVYPAMLNEPSTVRSRAQTAYTISSTIAAALITAGVLADITKFGWLVQLLGVLAVAAWLTTAALFINISRRVRKVPRTEQGQLLTVKEFVSRSLNVATDEADALETQLTAAAIATYAALGLTGLAFLAALLGPPSPDRPQSTIVLTPAGAHAVQSRCKSAGSELSGELHVDTLDDKFTLIDVKDACGAGTVTVRVPPKDIAAVTSAK